MKAEIAIKEVKSVTLYTQWWTDYLTIRLSDGITLSDSCYHYEESMSQKDKCSKLKKMYDKIRSAIDDKKEFVEIDTGD